MPTLSGLGRCPVSSGPLRKIQDRGVFSRRLKPASFKLTLSPLIPSCILKSNSHIGEVGQGTDAVGISSELGEACAERVLQSIKGRERLVGQDLLPQFFPDMLGWIEFRTAGRLGQ